MKDQICEIVSGSAGSKKTRAIIRYRNGMQQYNRCLLQNEGGICNFLSVHNLGENSKKGSELL